MDPDKFWWLATFGRLSLPVRWALELPSVPRLAQNVVEKTDSAFHIPEGIRIVGFRTDEQGQSGAEREKSTMVGNALYLLMQELHPPGTLEPNDCGQVAQLESFQTPSVFHTIGREQAATGTDSGCTATRRGDCIWMSRCQRRTLSQF